MGQPKLLMPWKDGRLIDSVLRVWTESSVTETLVVVRAEDHALQEACRRWPVHLVIPPRETPDMKASVIAGLEYLRKAFNPDRLDRCFIAPADLPMLSSSLVEGLCQTDSGSRIAAPRIAGKPGHPVLLPWELTAEIAKLPEGQGVNAIVDRHPPMMVDFPGHPPVEDVDTPQDYRRAVRLSVDGPAVTDTD